MSLPRFLGNESSTPTTSKDYARCAKLLSLTGFLSKLNSELVEKMANIAGFLFVTILSEMIRGK
jgi:hypothetical protein